jgi:hypothetical protein
MLSVGVLALGPDDDHDCNPRIYFSLFPFPYFWVFFGVALI